MSARQRTRVSADAGTLPGKQRVGSAFVFGILQRIHAVGWENFDPTKDGRANPRPQQRKIDELDNKEYMDWTSCVVM